MKGSETVRKKSYSLIYRIYRRIRFVRFLKKKRKRLIRQHRKEKVEEQKLLKQGLKEHVRRLREQERVKLRYEKDRWKKEQEEIRQRLREQSQLLGDIQKEESLDERQKRRKEKVLLRKKRRRLARYRFRLRMKALFQAVLTFRPSAIPAWLQSRAPVIGKYIRILLNSTTLFLLSYLSLYLLAQAMTILSAMLFHYPTTFYYWEIYFNISVEDWYHDSVRTIFSSGPVIAVLTGIVFMVVFNNMKEVTRLFKLFFLWGFLHGISMLFGAMLVGSLFESGIGHVISWMYIMDTGKVTYSIISIFMLSLAGLISIKPFLLSGNTYFNNMTRVNRRPFIWAQVILPYILGSIILIALRQPRFMFYETFVTLTMAISLIPVISAYPAYPDLYFDEDNKPVYFEWKYFLMLTAVILFYRGILNFGISFPG